jgi:hypothetical protein
MNDLPEVWNMMMIPKLKLLPIALLFSLLLSSCSLTANEMTDNQIWIDVPLNGINFESGQMINIEGHAANAGEDLQVEVWVNAVEIGNPDLVPAKGNLSYFTYNYLPPGPGDYIIQVVLVGAAGENLPSDTAHVTVGGDVEETMEITPSPTTTMTPEVSLTPSTSETATQTPKPMVQFWAEPLPVQAGGCTTIFWETKNVSKVVIGGVEQPFNGSYQVCDVCEPQNYRLIVTYMDNREETFWVETTITGSCATATSTVTVTPTPTPEDTTPPPAPAPSVPADGLSLSCRPSQTLTWMPVSDPSGITEYQVEVQRSSDNNTWSSAAFSPINELLDKTTEISTECGWYYRWRVRAVDGAGNISDWSPWSYFSITLA